MLRFHISFPDAYPRLPPLVTFATDMFHPLITPLTTYMYTTDIQENGTVSATDEERLPPGGFSLRHGFPEWFGRGRRHSYDGVEGRRSLQLVDSHATPRNIPQIMKPLPDTPESAGRLSDASPEGRDNSIYDVLKYIRSTFDSEETMDSITLNAAGNPGAWHAWRSHQRKQGKLREEEPPSFADAVQQEEGQGQGRSASSTDKSSQNTGRRPGEWNWAGVWEDRVKKNIAMSLSEPVLYGGAATASHDELVSRKQLHKCSGVPYSRLMAANQDNQIRFLPLEDGEIDSIKENIRRTLEVGPSVRESIQ